LTQRTLLTRFAPAPTGHLHLGHVVNALAVWGEARSRGGRVLLRIEDHDGTRCRPEYEASIREDLAWLGFVPDLEAPRQSERGARYLEALETLAAADAENGVAAAGGASLVYPCDCSRRDIARVVPDLPDEELVYPGRCRTRRLAPDSTLGRRVRMDAGAESFTDARLGPQTQSPAAQCGDLLVRDRRGHWTYQFAVTVDDFDQGVNLIVRGEDLLASTGRQLRLARLLGRATPPEFLHHPLIRKPTGEKLSKSSGDTGVRELRAAGLSADAVRGMAAGLAGIQI